MKRFQALISLVLIIGLTYFSFYSLMPQSGAPASIPVTEFSTERALIPLKEISKAPHYIGTKEHKRVYEECARRHPADNNVGGCLPRGSESNQSEP